MGRAYFLPAPTGGLNVRDPILLKPETDAERVDNVVCEAGYIRNRGAELEFCDTGSGKVKTLKAMKLENGSEVFLATSSDFNFYDITSGTASDKSATYDAAAGAAFTDPIWQCCVYRHRIFGCNGVDRPFVWTGAGDVNTAGWTGPASNGNKLSSVQPYRSRLYFCEYQNASIWYTANVDAITGALTEVPLDSVLHLGGFPVFAGSSSNRVGEGNQELFVIYTSEGEVLIYQGRYPGDQEWSIVARYRIAKPLYNANTAGNIDYRCFLYIESKLYLVTRYGTIGIHELLSGVDFNDPFQIESGKVRQLFVDNTVTNLYSNQSTVYHPAKNYALINLGDTDGATMVVNTITKAWSRWNYVFAGCWEIFNNKLYYGWSGTANGKVYEMDKQFGTSAYDYYYWLIEHASSFLGNSKSSKKVTLFQPLFSAQKTSGAESGDSFTYGIEVDGALTSRATEVDTVSTTTLTLDYRITSSTPTFSKPIVPLVGAGKSVALRMEDIPTAYSNQVVTDVRYYGSWLEVEDGAGLA